MRCQGLNLSRRRAKVQGCEPQPPFVLARPPRQIGLCVCDNKQIAIPKSIQDAVLESLYLTHPGIWGMTTHAQYAFWPYMHWEILKKAAKCKPCTEIGKNLKPVIPASKWHPLVSCSEPNEELQIDFGRAITSENDQAIHFLACIDHFSKYPSAEVFDKAKSSNVVKFLGD